METIISTKGKSLAFPSLITLLCLDARVNVSDDDVPIHAAKAISARRISEYKLDFKKKQPQAPSTSRPPIPRHQTQAQINQLLLDNQVVLAQCQDVMYESLKSGQRILLRHLIDMSLRVYTEMDVRHDSVGQSSGDKDNDDDEPTTT
ncbi:phage recombination protein Bet [Sesbania bispinosa]|nr:phage recombination protein Bet [Sesbania bispinosa]